MQLQILPVSSVFFRFVVFWGVCFFFRFFPFSSFLPFSSVSFSEKSGETLFARPILRNPELIFDATVVPRKSLSFSEI